MVQKTGGITISARSRLQDSKPDYTRGKRSGRASKDNLALTSHQYNETDSEINWPTFLCNLAQSTEPNVPEVSILYSASP